MRVQHLIPVLMGVLLQAQAPSITFDRTHADLGRISADKKVSTRFKVTNAGNAPLQISAVNASCGCTSTMLGNWYLKPGESSDIEAVFDPTRMKGIVRKSLTVVSNDPKNPSALLTFEADVVQEVMTNENTVFFSNATRTAPQTKVVKIWSGTGDDLTITDAKVPGAPYLALSTRKEGKETLLTVTLDGPRIPANLRYGHDQITLQTSNPRMPTLQLPVNWSLRPVFQMDPVRVSWDAAKAGQALSRTVTMKHMEGKAFRILGFRTSKDILSVSAPGAAGPEQRFTITLAASAKPGRYSEQVVVQTDDPEEKELTVRVFAVLE